MALNIRNAETERLANRVAALTDGTKTAAVTQALRERLECLDRARKRRRLADDLDLVAARRATRPTKTAGQDATFEIAEIPQQAFAAVVSNAPA